MLQSPWVLVQLTNHEERLPSVDLTDRFSALILQPYLINRMLNIVALTVCLEITMQLLRYLENICPVGGRLLKSYVY